MSEPGNNKNVITFKAGTVVSGFEHMGRLIIALANEVNHERTLPATWGALKKFADDKKLDVTLEGTGAGYGDYEPMKDEDPVHFETYDNKQKLRIMLPYYDDMLLSADEENELAEMNNYPLPKFYSQLAFGGQPKNIEDPGALLLHRIGEYTTQKCR